jgi:hypothetical protein
MRSTVRPAGISWLASVSAAIWMYGAGTAWAGDGGDSLGTIQAIIGPVDGSTGFCHLLGMGTNFGTTCPQLPTVTQAILEAAALGLSPPEMVAAQNSIAPGSNVIAANPAAVVLNDTVTPFPLTSKTTPKLSDLLSTLTPLAFISAKNSNGTAAPTQLYDTDADTFLYAVTASTFGIKMKPGGTVPDTALFFYDDLSRNSNFSRGQTAAKFLLPLTVLNVDATGKVSERAVPATLNLIAPTADCSASTVTGDFMGKGGSNTQTVKAADIALQCAVVFGKSPTSNENHAIFQVAIPLLVTGTSGSPYNTDPAYFYSFVNTDPVTGAPAGPINIGLFTAFTFFDDVFGTPASANPPILGANGIAIGIAPTAGPLCTAITCPKPPPDPPPPPPPGSIHFALCANLPRNNGNAPLVPSVGAYYAIATDGEALLSAALPGVSTSVCPQLKP